MQRESVRLQMEASQKMLESAHAFGGSAADLDKHRTMAHDLMDKLHTLTDEYYKALRKQMGLQ
jgi:division protein CdvB (Snf7/Vps24/ESCRT-III family)